MALLSLIVVFLIALSVRLIFLAFHYGDLNGLWSDYEVGGPRFRLAGWLDTLTLLVFAIVASISLFNFHSAVHPRSMVFVAALGLQLLTRFASQRFPRMNVSGAFFEAKVNFGIHLFLSLLGALVATLLASIYLWWRS